MQHRKGFRRQARRGFALVMTAICIIVLIGMMGLAVDLGRAYIVKNEAQAFTDAAALAAAVQLNGSSRGILNAKSVVASLTSNNRWQFNKRTFSSVVLEFSENKVTWSENPASATNIKYARVTATVNDLPSYFMPVVGASRLMRVSARSMAGSELPTSFPQGVFPFAPFAKSNTPPNFGYNYGDELTLLWPSSIGSNGPVKMNNLCKADRNQAALDAVAEGTTADRGYIMDTSASAIAAAIEDDRMDYTVTLGMPVSRSGGVKHTDVKQSLAERVAQDSNPTESNYQRYLDTHDASPLRRVVIVPIISNATDAIVLGFAKVFLPPSQPPNPNDAKCAMYIGPATGPVGNIATGANFVRLLE
ncbi:MAG: pilus assembly protein TadG-related protein [Bryobacteraceae bacterium]